MVTVGKHQSGYSFKAVP